jgi:hypothetical protein
MNKFFAVSACFLFVTGCKEKAQVSGDSGSVPIAVEEGVILAIADELMPPGTVKEEDFSMELKDGKIKITLPEQEIEGALSMKEVKKRKFESIAEGKYRISVLEDRKTERSQMMGQEQPAKETVNPLEGRTVIAERGADGVWKTALESGEATAEMEKEISKITESLSKSKDAQVYGTVARKVGDEWTVNAGEMMEFKDAEGTIKLRFDAIEEHKGQRCAKLTGTLDITGAPADSDMPGMKMRMAGAVIIFRSIEHRTDLSNELKGTMEMSGEMEPQPGMKMRMSMAGNMESLGSAKVTKAE